MCLERISLTINCSDNIAFTTTKNITFSVEIHKQIIYKHWRLKTNIWVIKFREIVRAVLFLLYSMLANNRRIQKRTRKFCRTTHIYWGEGVNKNIRAVFSMFDFVENCNNFYLIDFFRKIIDYSVTLFLLLL